MIAITPRENESQPDFAARAHAALVDDFPVTDERNAEVFRLWRQSRGQSDEEKKAFKKFQDDQFAHLTDVPIFKEHGYVRTLRNPDGTPQLDAAGNPKTETEYYDFDGLKAIAENCNFRIRNTGNFAPISDVHNGKNPGLKPEVFGFSGPFRLGMVGNEDPCWAIFSDEHWFKDKFHKAREMPTRSPEIYVGRPMERRFLDPVTALGAETPALDTGLHYRFKDAGRMIVETGARGQLIERYSAPEVTICYDAAVFPGGGNAFIPAPVGGGKKKEKEEYCETPKSKYSEESKMDDPTIAAAAPSQTPNADLVNACVAAFLQTEPMQWVIQQMQAAAAPTVDKTPVGGEEKEMLDEEESGPLREHGEEETPFGEKMESAESDESAEFEKSPPEENDNMAAEKQAKHDDAIDKNKAAAEKETERKEEYSLRSLRREFSTAFGELKAKYDAQSAEIVELKKAVGNTVAGKIDDSRRSEFEKLRLQGYILDVDEEMESYAAAKATDEVFQNHCDRIVARYQKAPIGLSVHAPALDVPERIRARGDAGKQPATNVGEFTEDFAKEVVQYSQEAIKAGKILSYDECRQAVLEKRRAATNGTKAS